jgi:8-amino-7-oxononanoate synthase
MNEETKDRNVMRRLSESARQELIRQGLSSRQRRTTGADTVVLDRAPVLPDIPASHYRFDQHPSYLQLRALQGAVQYAGVESPYFRVHDGIAAARTSIANRHLVNFSSYNYLGFSGDPIISDAAKSAIDTYGTSVSASRLVSGERALHRGLERELACLYDVGDAITFVSGHATNVSVLGYLFGPRDLILHDALSHNSIIQGIRLSGAHRLPFPHNDWKELDHILTTQRHQFERVLIVVEGLYSMDGDIPDLPRFVELKRRHRTFLMVDDAHALGVLGRRGYGIREHFGLAGSDVDIWMGTLSKSLAACGGYIAGDVALIEHLKYLAPGFLYSVGLPPPIAAAALAALRQMQAQPERVAALQARSRYFFEQARRLRLNTGQSTGHSIVPVIVGGSIKATRLSNIMYEQGFNVQPILYPAVPEQTARLRFFLCCLHTEDDIDAALASLGDAFAEVTG